MLRHEAALAWRSEPAVRPEVSLSLRKSLCLAAFEIDLHQHIHLENNLLFPRAVEMEDTFYAA